MKVLYKWENCWLFNKSGEALSDSRTTAYYVEIPKEEITDKLYGLLTEGVFTNPDDLKNGRYFSQVNRWVKINPRLANKNCAYVLVDKDVTSAFLCAPYYPYSSQWGGYCPFQYLYETELNTGEYISVTIKINDIDVVKKLEELLQTFKRKLQGPLTSQKAVCVTARTAGDGKHWNK